MKQFKVGQQVRVRQTDQLGTPPSADMEYAVVRAPARLATVMTGNNERITEYVHDLTAVMWDGREIEHGLFKGNRVSYCIPVAWLEPFDEGNLTDQVSWQACIWRPDHVKET
jgi:hypothetical protein